MLSKEEIEKAKDFMIFYKNYCLNKETVNIENYETVNDEEFVYKNIEIILEYIEQLEQEKADRTHAESYEKSYIFQLESDKQKLIEKLEKRIKLNNKKYGQVIDEDEPLEMYEYSAKVEEDKYILKILKGGNRE